MSFDYMLLVFLAISFFLAFAALGSILYIQKKQKLPSERGNGDRRNTDRRQGERRIAGRESNDRRNNDRRSLDRRVKTGSLFDRRIVIDMFSPALSD